MLSSNAAKYLVSLLSNTNDSLSSITEQFNNFFSSKNRLTALNGCSLLLLDGLLDHQQQFVSLWLLLFADNPPSETDTDYTHNPYFSVFKSIYESFSQIPNFYAPQVYSLIHNVLSKSNLTGFQGQPIKVIYGPHYEFPQSKNIPLLEKTPVSVERFSPVLITSNDDQSLTNNRDSIKLNDYDSSTDTNIILSHTDVQISLLQEETFYSNFEPIYIRPVPEVSAIFTEEPNYINAGDLPIFLFDEDSMANNYQLSVELLKKAFGKKLKANESDLIINQLKKSDSNLLEEVRFPNAKISYLIENNCDVAKSVIQNLVPKNPSVLNTLVNLGVSASSVDVVRHLLTTIPELCTQEFTDSYIANAVKSILSIKDNPTMQRKARIFLKMIDVLIQSGYHLTPKSILELNSFCEDTKIKNLKEAQEINQLLFSS